MRKRVPVVVGGGIALLIASQYLNFGLGLQDDSGPGAGDEPSAQVSVDLGRSSTPTVSEPDAVVKEPSNAPELTSDTPSPTESAPLDVVDIVIDGNQYLVLTDASEDSVRQSMTLDEIVSLAETVVGESSGIRVRIARTPDAVAATDAAVMRRLSDAGFNADQIDARRQLVELP